MKRVGTSFFLSGLSEIMGRNLHTTCAHALASKRIQMAEAGCFGVSSLIGIFGEATSGS